MTHVFVLGYVGQGEIVGCNLCCVQIYNVEGLLFGWWGNDEGEWKEEAWKIWGFWTVLELCGRFGIAKTKEYEA